jgi:hypothetical protein
LATRAPCRRLFFGSFLLVVKRNEREMSNIISYKSYNNDKDAARHVPTGSDQLRLVLAIAGHSLSQRS